MTPFDSISAYVEALEEWAIGLLQENESLKEQLAEADVPIDQPVVRACQSPHCDCPYPEALHCKVLGEPIPASDGDE